MFFGINHFVSTIQIQVDIGAYSVRAALGALHSGHTLGIADETPVITFLAITYLHAPTRFAPRPQALTVLTRTKNKEDDLSLALTLVPALA